MLTKRIKHMLHAVLAVCLTLGATGCAVLEVAILRPLPPPGVALAGIDHAQQSLADSQAYAQKNIEAAATGRPVASHGASRAAYQRWANDDVRELPEPSTTVAIMGGGN